ncbi:hypothetical protein BB561_002106 [Smittium simulii]|uniref:Major facilitator superfamily (MFS) profile domain-containing protein n=1 Tax=Smittium simulii TaxID=133385 RepID=A0A2T9YRL2_9FUNG|nr:hypothetical protein BB561_002106 [Smittium simulii]
MFLKNPFYTSHFQIIYIGLICFCVPGMYNSLNSMGGGGQLDTTTGSNANTALYATFTIFGLFSGCIINLLGVRFTIFSASITYALYTCSFVYYNNTKLPAPTIIAGCLLGIGAAVLWAGQGMMMTSYPLEHEKGKFIFIFWGIYNMGGVLGSIIPTVINSDKDLSNSGYIAFTSVQVFGAIMSLFLCPPTSVIRSDGSNLIISKQDNVIGEVIQILKLFTKPSTIALFFLSLPSNYFYSLFFNVYNGANFTTRSKGFNNIFYWASEILGSYITSLILDSKLGRKKRAYYGTSFVVLLFNTLLVSMIFQLNKFNSYKSSGNFPLDFQKSSSSIYSGALILYIFLGIASASWQTLAYWLIGSYSNDSTVLSRYVGFFKGVQSAGSAISWAVDAANAKPIIQLVLVMAFFNLAVPFMYYICYKTTETNELTKSDVKDGHLSV